VPQEQVPHAPQSIPEQGKTQNSEIMAGNNDYPTPEATPDRTTAQDPIQDIAPEENASQSTQEASRASEISADFTETNILPEGARRHRKNARREAYFAALDDVEELSGYHSAFTAALADSKRPHRDSLPPEPKNWKEMLRHPFATQFTQAAQVEFDELCKRQTFQPVAKDTIPREHKILPLIWYSSIIRY